MGYKQAKADILDGALAAAFDDGLNQLPFGRVAKRLGIRDRIVVYCFPTKDDLIGEVLYAMGAELQVPLTPAFSVRKGVNSSSEGLAGCSRTSSTSATT